jgi:hypothetical protein
MSDTELIARLRDAPADGLGTENLCLEAADRIEALTKERDEADDLAKAAFADGASNNIRLAETSYRVKWLEAKLAKAVEALGLIVVDNTWGLEHETYMKCRATLAEIKGGNDAESNL